MQFNPTKTDCNMYVCMCIYVYMYIYIKINILTYSNIYYFSKYHAYDLYIIYTYDLNTMTWEAKLVASHRSRRNGLGRSTPSPTAQRCQSRSAEASRPRNKAATRGIQQPEIYQNCLKYAEMIT